MVLPPVTLPTREDATSTRSEASIVNAPALPVLSPCMPLRIEALLRAMSCGVSTTIAPAFPAPKVKLSNPDRGTVRLLGSAVKSGSAKEKSPVPTISADSVARTVISPPGCEPKVTVNARELLICKFRATIWMSPPVIPVRSRLVCSMS